MELLKKHTFLWLFLILSASAAFGQKSEFKKADLMYRAKSYADAIPLYEKGLAKKNSKGARAKLAYCYKMLNQMDKAEQQYVQLVNEKRVRPDIYFYYGEVLMSKANYGEAKNWFLKYHELKPEEGKGLQMANACDQIPFLTPLYPTATVRAFPHNSKFDDTSPVFYNNGIVFSSDRKSGIKLMKLKSGATGRDFIRLYFSSPNEQNEWSKPKAFSGKLNELNKNNANASFLPDGSEVFFTRNSNISNRRGAYTLQLYSGKKDNGKWKDIDLLSVCRPAHNYMHPAISPDGKTLFFVSDKPGGKGGTDIYYCQRNGDKWGKAINLDSTINTAAHEGFPFVNEDGKLYFCSKGHIGYGGYDIFVSEKNEDGNWSKPLNVGQPINSPHDDISIFLNKENTKGVFTSSREGGDDDIYLFETEGGDVLATESTVPTTEPRTTEEVIQTEASTEITDIETTTSDDIPSMIDDTISSKIPPSSEPSELTNAPTIDNTEIPSINIAPSTATEVSIPDGVIPNNTTLDPLEEIATTQLPQSEEPSVKDEVSTELNQTVPNDKPKATIISLESETVVTESEPVSPVVSDLHTEHKMISDQSLNVSENKTEVVAITDSKMEEVNKPVTEVSPTKDPHIQQDAPEPASSSQLLSSKSFQKAVSKGKQEKGMYYLLENMNYFPGEYLLVPKMTLQLEPIAKMMEEQPELIIEIAAHTGSIGYDENNMTISKKRAKAIKNYLMYKGIAATRIIDIGYGETRLVNHCKNGVVCTEEEHMANQRVEIRVR